MDWYRRGLLLGGSLVLFAPFRRACAALDPRIAIARLENELRGRVGVAALDTRTSARISWRSGERFAMCSTFKWLLAAAVLSRCEHGLLTLDMRLPFFPTAFLPHSPVTAAHAKEGAMRVAPLCAAAVELSDNTAANTLLRAIGGPTALTAWLRRIGDPVTRLDRYELALNENLPGDPRDTTTPDETIMNFRRLLLGDVLTARSRALLIGWMRSCRTGVDRLRAGLPRDWVVADKTGTGTGSGRTSEINDIAVAWPPHRPPVLIVCYISGSSASIAEQNAAHARIARSVSAAFA